MKKKVKKFPVYTCDYPVYDYEDNSIHIVIYYNGKKVKSLKKEDAPYEGRSFGIWGKFRRY